jgi:hypothetical protein
MPTCTHRARVSLAAAARALALAATLLVSPLGGPAAAEPQQMVVVELFTSQGCKACRGAEKLLGELADEEGVLALGLHVDYWDYIGWKDPFASELFTARQQDYLDQLRLPYVYTPQMVVDGKLHASGNKEHEVRRNIARAREQTQGRVPIALDRISEGEIRLRIPGTDALYRGEAEIVLVRFDGKQVTEITSGENEGQSLVNYNIVRLMRPVASWNGEGVDMVLALQEIGGADPAYCAVFVQERGQGRILGAAVVNMQGPSEGG